MDEQRVVINGYQMDMSSAPREVILFELTFTAHRMVQQADGQQYEKIVKLAKGPRNE